MTNLTETVIDIADRHTTFYYLAGKPPVGPLPLYSEEACCALHSCAASGPMEYLDVVPGRRPALLGRLSPGYADNKYWLRYVGLPASAFPSAAWRRLLPLDASLTRRILPVLDPRFSFRVSPVPRVRLYPFGWSSWISLRLLGPHSISDLAAFLERLFSDGALRYDGDTSPMSVTKLFGDVARLVRADAFGGDEAHDQGGVDIAVVATVLAKHGGSPALNAPAIHQQAELRRIARPYGPPAAGPFLQHVRRLPPGDSDLEYMVYDRLGRFLWVEHLLEPSSTNHAHLRCYHNNSFVSLVHAWHLQGLLDVATGQAAIASTALQMALSALGELETPGYKCASLMRFLERPELRSTMEKADALKRKQ